MLNPHVRVAQTEVFKDAPPARENPQPGGQPYRRSAVVLTPPPRPSQITPKCASSDMLYGIKCADKRYTLAGGPAAAGTRTGPTTSRRTAAASAMGRRVI